MFNLEAYSIVMWIDSIAYSSGRWRSYTVSSVAIDQTGMYGTVDLHMHNSFYACLHASFEERWQEWSITIK